MTHHYSHVDEAEKKIAATRVLAVVLGKTSSENDHKEGIQEGIEGQPASMPLPEAAQVC